MFKRLFFLIVLLVGIAFGAEAFLPALMEQVLKEGLSSVVASREMETKISKTPALLMLTGEFDHIALKASDAKVDKLLISDIDVSMDNVALDLGKLFSERKVDLKKAGEIKLTAVITAEEMANYLNTAVKNVHEATVSITPEKAVVGSQWTMGGLAKIDLKLEGKIVSDNHKIKFIPGRFLINSSSVNTSSLFGGSLMSEMVILDSTKLPFGVVVRNVAMQDGRVVIMADNKIL